MIEFAPRLITPPAVKPVTLDEVKTHIKIEHNEEDARIGLLLDAVTAHLDGWGGELGRCLMTQTWEQSYPSFMPQHRLPLGPTSQVVSVVYADTNGTDQAVSADSYRLHTDHAGDFIALLPGFNWPAIDTRFDVVRVRWQAATKPEEMPKLKAGMLMLIGHLYKNPDAAMDKHGWPSAVTMFLNPLRARWIS